MENGQNLAVLTARIAAAGRVVHHDGLLNAVKRVRNIKEFFSKADVGLLASAEGPVKMRVLRGQRHSEAPTWPEDGHRQKPMVTSKMSRARASWNQRSAIASGAPSPDPGMIGRPIDTWPT